MIYRKVKVTEREAELMYGLDIALRLQIERYFDEHKQELVGILGNSYNVIITVLGKIFADLLAGGAVKGGIPLESLRQTVLELLNNEIDERYTEHKGEIS
jgi:hypothetical protein